MADNHLPFLFAGLNLSVLSPTHMHELDAFASLILPSLTSSFTLGKRLAIVYGVRATQDVVVLQLECGVSASPVDLKSSFLLE